MEPFSASESIHIDAPPEKIWSMVTDVTRMGEWSPETYRCEWQDGASGPEVGATFKGWNKSGLMRWSTKPKVVELEPNRTFAFEHSDPPVRWTYRLEPEEGGTRLTESYDVPAMSGAVGLVTKWMKRDQKMPANVRETLERIKVAAELS